MNARIMNPRLLGRLSMRGSGESIAGAVVGHFGSTGGGFVFVAAVDACIDSREALCLRIEDGGAQPLQCEPGEKDLEGVRPRRGGRGETEGPAPQQSASSVRRRHAASRVGCVFASASRGIEVTMNTPAGPSPSGLREGSLARLPARIGRESFGCRAVHVHSSRYEMSVPAAAAGAWGARMASALAAANSRSTELSCWPAGCRTASSPSNSTRARM